jgi:penicillin G amidase
MWIKRILIALAILIVMGIMTGIILIRVVSRKGLTTIDGKTELPGLRSDVTILRDSLGIPHIYAENEHDLYMSSGYVMAQDRLWQMDLLRRVTQGRLAEIFGSDLVETDLLMRALRIPEKSKQVTDSLDTEIKESLSAFSEGVNTFMKQNKNNLPFEFQVLGYEPEPWKPIHTANLIGYISWDLTMPWKNELLLHKIKQKVDETKYQSILPQLKEQSDVIFPDFYQAMPDSVDISDDGFSLLHQGTDFFSYIPPVFQGSNNWAVSGEKTSSGHALFANDMHLGLFIPGIWYQIHQCVKGSLNVTGVAIPGAPFIVAGHNDSIAWGLTNVMVDDMDFYLETINPEDSGQYLLDGHWKKFRIIKEVIKTSDGDEIVKELKFTHRGPVVSEFKDIKSHQISMKWIGNEFSNEVRSVYLLNRAQNWLDFKDAMKTFIAVSQNAAYADTHGNIGLYCCAGIPLRPGKPWEIYPGDTSLFDWKGLVPFDELPHTFNPEEGFVCSANNKTVDEQWPHYISMWFDQPWRYNRITQLIQNKDNLSVEDMKHIQTDQVSLLAKKAVPAIISALKKYDDAGKTEKEVLSLLQNRDYQYHQKAVCPLVFDKLFIQILKNTVHDELGEDPGKEFLDNKTITRSLFTDIISSQSSPWLDNINTGDIKETFEDIVIESYRQVIDDLTREYGGNPGQWTWGKAHTLELSHPLSASAMLEMAFDLNRGPYPCGGSFHTVCPWSYPLPKAFHADHGASHRHVYSAGNWDSSFTVIPTGNSGIPASKFYCNQTDMYINKEYHTDYFSEEKIKSMSSYTLILEP